MASCVHFFDARPIAIYHHLKQCTARRVCLYSGLAYFTQKDGALSIRGIEHLNSVATYSAGPR